MKEKYTDGNTEYLEEICGIPVMKIRDSWDRSVYYFYDPHTKKQIHNTRGMIPAKNVARGIALGRKFSNKNTGIVRRIFNTLFGV